MKRILIIAAVLLMLCVMTACGSGMKELTVDINGTEYTLMLPKGSSAEFGDGMLTVSVPSKRAAEIDLTPLKDCSGIEHLKLTSSSKSAVIDIPYLPKVENINIDCPHVEEFIYISPNGREEVDFSGTVSKYRASQCPGLIAFMSDETSLDGVFELTHIDDMILAYPCGLTALDGISIDSLSLNCDGWDLSELSGLGVKELYIYPAERADLSGIAAAEHLDRLTVFGPVDVSELTGLSITELEIFEADSVNFPSFTDIPDLEYLSMRVYTDPSIDISVYADPFDETGRLYRELFSSDENAAAAAAFMDNGGIVEIGMY